MRYSDIKIVEALKASQYRNLVKGWNKERYAEIFLNPKYKHDKNGYRVYIPIEEKFRPDNPQKSPTQIKIERELSKNNYEIVDYVKGLARPIGAVKNPVKLGKLLISLKRQDLLTEFNVDKSREGTKSTYMVVISRHPYDVAGMSTGRGWTSCMNLHTGINKRYVPLDIAAGSVVAYVTRVDDIDLKNPSGRLLIKPFIDIIGKQVIYFGIESVVYGTEVPGFKETVTKWVDEVNTAHELEDVVILKMNPNLYRDSELSQQVHITGKSLTPEVKDQIERVRKHPFDIFDIEDPSETVQITALSNGYGYDVGRLFTRMMSKPDYIPSERVQLTAVERNAHCIDAILKKNIIPSPAVQLAAVTDDWKVVRRFIADNIKMTDPVLEQVVEQHAGAMIELGNAGYKITKNMLIKGLRSNGSYLDQYYRHDFAVDTDVELAAIQNGYTDVWRLHRKYKETDQEIPPKLIDAMAIAERAYDIFGRILSHNTNNPNDIIPITENQLVHAMITDSKKQQMQLWREVLEAKKNGYYKYNDLISEKGWLAYLTQTTIIKYVVKKLVKENELSIDAVRKLVPLKGSLLELLPDAKLDEQYAAIKNDPSAIEFVIEPDIELQKLAVKLDPNAVTLIDKPSFDIMKLAAMYKETSWSDVNDSGKLSIYEFLGTIRTAFEQGHITEEDKHRVIQILIQTEPLRIISLIQYDDHQEFPVTNDLQLLAVEKSKGMIRTLMEHGYMPSTEVLIKYVESGGRISTVLDRISDVNRYKKNDDEKMHIDDSVYYAYLKKNTDPSEGRWLLNAILSNITTNPTPKVVSTILRVSPKAVVTALAHKLELPDNEIIDAVKHGGGEGSIPTLLSAIEQKYGTVPEEMYNAILDAPSSEDNMLLNFNKMIKWVDSQDSDLPLNVYKHALNINYEIIFMIERPSQELRDYNYKVNGYWTPFARGDNVKVDAREETPSNLIYTANDPYTYNIYITEIAKLKKFPRAEIHKANGVTPPADYNQKMKLFMKKYPDVEPPNN